MMTSIRIGIALLVVLGGILFLAMPACGCSTKEKAYTAAVKSDLRNLVTAQEALFAGSGRFTADPDTAVFRPSTGVTVRVIEVADSGWAAQGTHQGIRGVCAIWVGNVKERPRLGERWNVAGEPYCGEIRRRDR